MVKVQEVHDSPYTSSDSAHSGSSDSLASSISNDDEIQKESLVDRLVALVDIVPPQTRHSITTRVSNFVGAVKTSGKVVGNVVWVLTTSALLIGLPLAFALEDEAKIVQQEKEMAAQQQGVQQVRLYTFFFWRHSPLTFPSAAQMVNPGTNLYPQLDPSNQRKEGIVPPGF